MKKTGSTNKEGGIIDTAKKLFAIVTALLTAYKLTRSLFGSKNKEETSPEKET